VAATGILAALRNDPSILLQEGYPAQGVGWFADNRPMPPGKSIPHLVPDDLRKSLRRRRQPEWIDPMKAILTEDYFSDPDWVFEPKLDGVRCLAYKKGSRVRLMSRNKLSLNDRYPQVVEAVEKLKVEDAVLDGEVAVVTQGISRFQSLQRHLLEGGGQLVYFVFDAPHLGGYDVSKLPLVADNGDLRYAGKVGTGYDTKLLRALTRQLSELERADSPFAGKPPVRKAVHWVEPQLVVQVGFAEWTRDGRLRHPRFLGIRDDKAASEVVRETG
jgi:ATP-dependent DNA ligase